MIPVEVQRIARMPGRYFVFWVLGNRCTYECSYCPSHFHDGSFPYHDIESVLNTLKMLPPANVMFSGGEPTYHPDFERILENKPAHVMISVISNASRPLGFWERAIRKLDLVILTYHVEFAKIDRFVEIAKMCGKKLDRINLTMLQSRWEECVAVYERLKSENLPVVPKTLVKDFGALSVMTEEYTSEQKAWLTTNKEQEKSISLIMFDRLGNELKRSTPGELLAQKKTDFRGWICEVPLQTLYIDYTKRVFDSSCKQRRILGSIDEGFELPTTPIQCHTAFCWCHSDLMATKTRSRSFDLDAIITHVKSDPIVLALARKVLAKAKELEQVAKSHLFDEEKDDSHLPEKEMVTLRRLAPRTFEETALSYGVVHGLDCEDTEDRALFPEVDQLIEHFLVLTGFSMERLGRIRITKLPAGESVIRHMDYGYYFHYYNQVHIPLQSGTESLFQVGPNEEKWKEVNMSVGSIYDVNNSRNHSATNNGDTDRYHLIVDLRLNKEENASRKVRELDRNTMA